MSDTEDLHVGTFLTQDMHVQVDEVKISDYPGNSHICMPSTAKKWSA